MKKPENIFDIKRLSDRIHHINEDENFKNGGCILIQKVFSGPLTAEKIDKFIYILELKETTITQIPDYATRWNALTRHINRLGDELKKKLNTELEALKTKILGNLIFKMILDGSFGLYYEYNPDAVPNKIQDDDIIIEQLDDNSFMIEKVSGEVLGMAGNIKESLTLAQHKKQKFYLRTKGELKSIDPNKLKE